MTEEVYTPDLWEELLTAKSLFGEQSGRDFGNALFDHGIGELVLCSRVWQRVCGCLI